MAVPRNRVARFLTDSRPQPESVFYSLSNFYREEFIKCQRCLDAQREYLLGPRHQRSRAGAHESAGTA